MSDSINPIGLGTAVAAGALAGAVAPTAAAATQKVSKKVAETIAIKAPKADAFIKSASKKTQDLGKDAIKKVKDLADPAVEKLKDIAGAVKEKFFGDKFVQPDLFGKETVSTKIKTVFSKIADGFVAAAKFVNEKVLTPIGKFAKKPAVAGAVLAGVAFLVLSKVFGSKEV